MTRSLADRFWEKVDKRGPDECWPWIGVTTNKGYGRLRGAATGGAGIAQLVLCHRISWELHNGPIPEGEGYHGICVCHRCDTPLCVNPAHLFLGTHTENLRDMIKKGRAANGREKLTKAQVLEIRESTQPNHALAVQFGVSKNHICGLRRGLFWKDAKAA